MAFEIFMNRSPPRYSQQYMPQTSFTCRNKIIGSYYADSETDCQLFHVCVSVAGSVQDYRFLCPNDTAFDQESQTCADWYDVDCEAATLYYASDNFDLYRIGSGLESLHYDSVRSDIEPQDHLQRSESNDLIRSPLNFFMSKNSETSNKNNIKTKDHKEYFTSSNSKIAKNNNEEVGSIFSQKQVKETNNLSQKTNRQFLSNNSTNVYNTSPTTSSVSSLHFNRGQNFGDNLLHSTFNQRYTSESTNVIQKLNLSTLKTQVKYTTPSIKLNTYSQTIPSNYSTTIKPQIYSNQRNLNRLQSTEQVNSIHSRYSEQVYFKGRSNQSLSENQQSNNYDSKYSEKSNNNNYYSDVIDHRTPKFNTSSSFAVTSSQIYNKQNNLNFHPRPVSKKLSIQKANVITENFYTPTTYNPITKLSSTRQSHEKSISAVTPIGYVNTDHANISKKVTHSKNYEDYDSNTKAYNFARSSIGLQFSPSSINHLAENYRTTTAVSRKSTSSTNTHTLLNQAIQNLHTNKQPTQRFSTTPNSMVETTTYKITKKNDYDYAYYDTGVIEYDNIELEHVNTNKESVKIT